MDKEYNINLCNHERYPVHLKYLRKIKYSDFQIMTLISQFLIYSNSITKVEVSNIWFSYFQFIQSKLSVVEFVKPRTFAVTVRIELNTH